MSLSGSLAGRMSSMRMLMPTTWRLCANCAFQKKISCMPCGVKWGAYRVFTNAPLFLVWREVTKHRRSKGVAWLYTAFGFYKYGDEDTI